MRYLLRLTRLLGVMWFMAWGFGLTANAQTACTRDSLKGYIQKYFAALEAQNSSGLPLASNVKFTENGVELAVGKGFWQTAGKTLLKRDLIDTQKCGTHSNVVIEEKYIAPKTAAPAPKSAFPGMQVKIPPDGSIRPILYGVRLKIENEKIAEIETFVARETEFAFNAAGVLATKDQDWESILPLEERSSPLPTIILTCSPRRPRSERPLQKFVIVGKMAFKQQPNCLEVQRPQTWPNTIARPRASKSSIMHPGAF
jgi:hypothetical protein